MLHPWQLPTYHLGYQSGLSLQPHCGVIGAREITQWCAGVSPSKPFTCNGSWWYLWFKEASIVSSTYNLVTRFDLNLFCVVSNLPSAQILAVLIHYCWTLIAYLVNVSCDGPFDHHCAIAHPQPFVSTSPGLTSKA